MSAPVRYGRAVAAARRLLRRVGVRTPEAIDPVVTAAHLGVEIVVGKLDGATARLYCSGARARIRVSDRVTAPGHRRFSVAHELGHYVLGHSPGDEDLEREADAFAIELLMPELLVRRYCDGAEVTPHRAQLIAHTFTASLVASAFRLVELSTEPCAAVYSIANLARWVKRSSRCHPAFARQGEIEHSQATCAPDTVGVLSLFRFPVASTAASDSLPATEVQPWTLCPQSLLAPR